jgi:hypothetical protein
MDLVGRISLNPLSQILQINEEVFVVARQSRLKPGGSAFTPNIVLIRNGLYVYATNARK